MKKIMALSCLIALSGLFATSDLIGLNLNPFTPVTGNCICSNGMDEFKNIGKLSQKDCSKQCTDLKYKKGEVWNTKSK